MLTVYLTLTLIGGAVSGHFVESDNGVWAGFFIPFTAYYFVMLIHEYLVTYKKEFNKYYERR